MGCSTIASYTPTTKGEDRLPREPSEIIVFGLNQEITIPYTVIGKISVGEAPFTIMDGDLDSEINKAKIYACRHGADAIKVTKISYPNALTSNFRIKVSAIIFDEVEKNKSLVGVSFTKEEFKKQFDEKSSLTELEGIWKDSSGMYKIGILGTESGDHTAFIIESNQPGWNRGTTKVCFEPTAQAGLYLCNYISRNFLTWSGTATVNGALLSITFNDEQRGGGSMSFLKLYPRGAPQGTVSSSTGTGFAVSADGYIITAYHVVDGADSIQVVFDEGDWIEAKLVKKSIANDIALLKIDQTLDSHLSFAPYGTLQQGDHVYTVGYPVTGILGKDSKYTDGTVSSLSGIEGEDSLLQITVAVQPGNSGGPLLNDKGELVGMITSTAAVSVFYNVTGAFPQNINWAVKDSYIKMLVPPSSISDSLETVKDVSDVTPSICFIKVTK